MSPKKHEELEQLAEKYLGYDGRILGSEIAYLGCHPDNFIVFKAKVFLGKFKVWSGDLDITISEDTLKQLSIEAKEPIYVLGERSEDSVPPGVDSLEEEAMYWTDGDKWSLHKNIFGSYSRDKRGNLSFFPEMRYGKYNFSHRIYFGFMGFLEDLVLSSKRKIDFYMAFYIWLSDELGINSSKEFIKINSVYLTRSDMTELGYIHKRFLQKMENVPDFKLNYYMNKNNLIHGPSTFLDKAPPWARNGYVYVRSDYLTPLEDIKDTVNSPF